MTFRWLATVCALLALGLTPTAGATPPEGVHGAATQTLPGWNLSVNVNRTGTDALRGTIQFLALSVELFEWGQIQAKPVELEISGDTACVVGEVTRSSVRGGDLGYTPAFIVVRIRDVEGGPDLFSVTVIPSDFTGDRDFCPGGNPPVIPVETGNFTITGGT